MKIKIDKEKLLTGIQTVQNIVSSKVTLPILNNILIETTDGKIKFNATDLDIGISCELPVEIVEKGLITVPAKRFSDIIKELPQGEVQIHIKKNHQIDISGNTFQFKLNGLPADEFPKFPEFENKTKLEIDQAVLKEMLRLTAFAASHEESRYVLNGVLMEISGNNITLVATDGHRLAKSEQNLKSESSEDFQMIIPSKAVHEISRNLKDEGVVQMVFGHNQVLFNIDGVLIATRVIEGEYPNYRQVIPEEAKKKVKVSRDVLLSAIRRANLLSTPDFQAVKFELFKTKLVISKTTPDVGESREEVEIDYDGQEQVVGFNPVFLMDYLKTNQDEDVELELLGADKPAVMRNSNYLYLALPMRV